ncbi:MAG: DUF4369 domain-containing protein [Sanguibacteroides justesenii]|jgi:hypothetical protein|uniref:DUF4369 domain-containing protein n=1 Tax=Butyricimonas faecalis TaxID=2093856 RepID=UPI001DC1C30E|nr:DUF4369 domain-containing protein [Sanguibacteroides justesenii]
MKQILLLIMIFMMMISNGYAQKGFRISGKVADMPDGMILLLGRTDSGGLDTLGKTELKAGVFELNGQVENGCETLIMMPDGETGVRLLKRIRSFQCVA